MHYIAMARFFYYFCLLIAVVVTGWTIFAFNRQPRPFDMEASGIKELLRFPWQDFIPITESEKKIIRDLELGEPIFMDRQRCWAEVPVKGLFAMRNRQAREQLALAINKMAAVQDGDLKDQATRKRYHQEIREHLAHVDKIVPDHWFPRYHLGLVHLWMGRHQTAREHLEAALTLSEKANQEAKSLMINRLNFHEAMAATHYALGSVLRVDSDTREQALTHYRLAAKSIADFLAENPLGQFATVNSSKEFFEFRYTNLETKAIWSDLIAAYLGSQDYHACDQVPEQAPDCNALSEEICLNRDKVFCDSLNAPEAISGGYADLYRRFYEGGHNEDEYLLWALSSLIGLIAANPGLDNDPILLNNAALLHIRTGSSKQAVDCITRARNTEAPYLLGFHLPESDAVLEGKDRINKRRIVIQLLAGGKFKTKSCPPGRGGRPSLYRRTYLDLYQRGEHPPSFPSVSACFDGQGEEHNVDRWLFIHLWRGLLEAGDFGTFKKEFDKLLDQQGIFPSYFRTWRKEVFALIGERAVRIRNGYKTQGEPDKAVLIDDFLLKSGYFDGATGLGFSLIQRSGPFFARLLQLLIVLLALAGFVVSHVVHRSLKTTFESFHRAQRFIVRNETSRSPINGIS